MDLAVAYMLNTIAARATTASMYGLPKARHPHHPRNQKIP